MFMEKKRRFKQFSALFTILQGYLVGALAEKQEICHSLVYHQFRKLQKISQSITSLVRVDLDLSSR